MAKKVRDVVVKAGEYQDRNTGERKARWQNVGTLMQNEDDGSYFILLERTFNPAGVPNPDNRDTVLLSCFVPQDRRQQQQGATQPARQQQGQESSAGRGQADDLNDEIPF